MFRVILEQCFASCTEIKRCCFDSILQPDNDGDSWTSGVNAVVGSDCLW